MSHTLWTGWICWTTGWLCNGLASALRSRLRLTFSAPLSLRAIAP